MSSFIFGSQNIFYAKKLFPDEEALKIFSQLEAEAYSSKLTITLNNIQNIIHISIKLMNKMKVTVAEDIENE